MAVISSLPEQLIEQAGLLLRNSPSNEASVRRGVSAAYYALFHLLVRDAVASWKYAEHHARLARAFDHRRMKEASTAMLKETGNDQNPVAADSARIVRFKLSIVAQAFVDLQQARHKADYDISGPFNPLEAAVSVAQAQLALLNWAEVRDEPIAQDYLYSLLFKDKL